MIAIIDYGMGNLRSVQKAFEKVGTTAQITQSREEINNAQRIVLPGVGAMRPAMEKLRNLNLIDTIQKVVAAEKPFLGICLGFQLLFETSTEGGETKGLGILKGTVKRFQQLKVPQIGWNQLHIQNTATPLFNGIENLSNVYFCHSYFVQPKNTDVTTTTTEYPMAFTSSVRKENVFGVQFHPEKSQTVGLKILKNFATL